MFLVAGHVIPFVPVAVAHWIFGKPFVEDAVGDVVVGVDQPRRNDPIGVDESRVLIQLAVDSAFARLTHADDPVALHEHFAVFKHESSV